MEAGASKSNGNFDITAKNDDEPGKNGNQAKATNTKANKLKKKLKKKLAQLGIDILIICEGVEEDVDSSDENQNVSSKESKVKDEKDIDGQASDIHNVTDVGKSDSLDEDQFITDFSIREKESNLEAVSDNETEELTESDNSDSDHSKSPVSLEEAKVEEADDDENDNGGEGADQDVDDEFNQEHDHEKENHIDTKLDMGGNTESKDKRELNMENEETDGADNATADGANKTIINTETHLDNTSAEKTEDEKTDKVHDDLKPSTTEVLVENGKALNKEGEKNTKENLFKDSSVDVVVSGDDCSINGAEEENKKQEEITENECNIKNETDITDCVDENVYMGIANGKECSDNAKTVNLSMDERQQENASKKVTIENDTQDSERIEVAAETEKRTVIPVESECIVTNENAGVDKEEEEAYCLGSSVNNEEDADVCDNNLAVEIDDTSDDDDTSPVDVSIKLHIEENNSDSVNNLSFETSESCEMEKAVKDNAVGCDSVKEDSDAGSHVNISERVCEEVESDHPTSMEYKADQESVDLKSTEQEWAQVFGVLENAEAELKTVTKANDKDELQQTASRPKEPEWTQEKVKLETEIQQLKRELEMARAEVKSSQGSARDQQARHNQTVMSLKLQIYKMQVAQKRERAASEKRLADVMSHLLVLEGKLRKEQKSLGKDMKQKKELIKSQQTEIVKLRNQNEQLLNAIKEIYAKGGMNGYMRESKRKTSNSSDVFENSGKNGKDKKNGNSNGRLGSVKDKFSWKNRSSLELSSTSFNLEKYLIKNERLCTSQEDLQNIGKDGNKGIPNGDNGHMTQDARNIPRQRCQSVTDRPYFTFDSKSPRNSTASPRNSQNFFNEEDYQNLDMNKSTSESSQLSENSSGVYSCSDQDISMQDSLHSMNSSYYGNGDMYDDEDEGHFSFSSTHINTVIDEEDVMGPVIHSGQMMSMGSMPMLANYRDKQRSPSDKNRPHSLSSVDLAYIEQQTENLKLASALAEDATPPSSPSYNQSKNELTPFQTFKTMFKRKGSKNKGSKKRTVSLSQSTNKEYSEALKKHFQKYDMS